MSVEPPGRELRRYRLLESLRAFAVERLRARGETEQLASRHAAYVLDLAERAADGLWGLDQASWLGRLETEQPNVRTALAWGFGQQDPEIGVRLAAALAQFWEMQGHYAEGHRWLDRALVAEGSVSSAALAQLPSSARMLIRPTPNGATLSGQMMPASSWLASMIAPIRRETPTP